MIRALRLGIPILVIALAVAMFSVSPALAAKGGNGKGPNSSSTSTPLTVSPNPAPYGTNTFVISGSGFKAGQMDWLTIGGLICCSMVTMDSAGAFSYTYNRLLDPGTYDVYLFDTSTNSWTLLAATKFTVAP